MFLFENPWESHQKLDIPSRVLDAWGTKHNPRMELIDEWILWLELGHLQPL